MQQSDSKRLDPPSQEIGARLPHKCKDLERNENSSMIMN